LYDNAVNIVKRLFREHPNEANLHLGRKLVSNFATHIAVDKVGSQALFSLFSKDYYTFSHCVQVALLGMAFCRFLGWSSEEINDFGMGALFHDVGKNSIDVQILNKPGKLQSEEFDVIRKHPLLGYQQLQSTEVMTPDQLSVVLQHHEAMDGSGYPQRVKGSHIHKYARVARIVDIFDALTTKRVYKDAMSSSDALRLLRDEMAHTLDEQLLESFTKFIAPELSPEELARGLRVQLQFGGQLQLQLEEGGNRVKGTFLGLEGEKYLILKVPGNAQVFDQLRQGKQIVVRYVSEGCVYGFRTQVMAQITYPFPIVFLTYPRAIENVNLRKESRVECCVASEIVVDDRPVHGFILDLTSQGCKFVLRSSPAVTAPRLEPNQPVHVRTSIPGDAELRSFAGVVRNLQCEQDRTYLGIQFVNLTQGALFLLKKFAAEHQRPTLG
jgi:c-di-GMP-binding flagellar brake protein YcgR